MTYTIKYKHPTWLFWRRIRKVKGDALEQQCWVIIKEDNSQVVLPKSMIIKFPAEWFIKRHKEAEAEAGQPLPLKV